MRLLNPEEIEVQGESVPLVVKQCANLELIQVGAGGTGSWLCALCNAR